MGVLAVIINRFILGPFARRFTSSHYVLIVTFGLSLILLNVEYSIWGAQVRFFKMPISPAQSIGPLLLTKNQLIVMAIAAVLMVGVHTMLKVTRLGKCMRAMSDNTTLAMTSGIDTKRITTITWFLSGSLAGVAGTVLGISEGNLTPASGELFLFVIFAAVIVGGVGSIYGAMAGAILIGLATEISAAFINPSYKLDIAFVILILDPAHSPERADRSRRGRRSHDVLRLHPRLLPVRLLHPRDGAEHPVRRDGDPQLRLHRLRRDRRLLHRRLQPAQRGGHRAVLHPRARPAVPDQPAAGRASRRCASRSSSRSSRSGGCGPTTSRSS